MTAPYKYESNIWFTDIQVWCSCFIWHHATKWWSILLMIRAHLFRVCRGYDHMVVRFTATYATMHTTTNVVSSNPAQGEVYSLQYYVIKFVSDFRQVSGLLWVSSTNKTDCHDIAEILLKVVLKTIILKVSYFISRTLKKIYQRSNQTM
jgi:formate/nitrite transporter FocA (FNT family)